MKRESRRGYAGNQPRHVVADAPNGYFSGSLGERVSKPALSPSNDRSSAMCRFESCRPHQIFFSIARSWLELEDTPHLKRGAHSSVPVRVRRSAPLAKCLSRPWLELEYTLRSKRSAFGRAGSNPAGRTTFRGSLAQLAELPALNRRVEGSTPSRSTTSPRSSRARSSRVEHPAFNRTARVRSPPRPPNVFCCGFV